jgi:quinoprotein glucose dehydrogenase
MKLTLILFAATMLSAQEWRYWGGDSGGTRYSKLKQIDRSNVTKLRVAWTYNTGDVSDGKTLLLRSAFEATPLVIDNVMYVTTPFQRLIALDPETGKELWAFDPKIDKDKPNNLYISRGVSFWTDGTKKRIVFGTQTGLLFSIDLQPDGPIQPSAMEASSTCVRVSPTIFRAEATG